MSKENEILERVSSPEKADKDNAQLEALGYAPELKRSFSVWSVLGVGFGLTNSWFGISASLITGIASGGPLLIVYGIIIIASVSTCIGITLSEMSSAFPSAGGQYVWTKLLAPPKWAAFWAYMCGSFAYAGAIFTSASVTLSIASQVVGFYAMMHPDFIYKPWHVFVAYQLLNIFCFFFNCYGRWLPQIANSALYISLFSFVVITITVLSCSSGNYQSADFVFREFNNQTGWSSAGIAFLVGLVNPNWSFSCLDCATHLAEEVANPESVIPIAIMGTVAIGFVTSFCYSIAMFFSIHNLDAIYNSNTGVPIFDIYLQALGNRAGAICLGVLIFLTAIGCNIASHTWQQRLCWSFARDNGLWGSRWWSRVDPRLGVPFNAHLMSCVWCAIIGCIYLGSSTAYNAMVTACITFLLLSYCVPTCCLLYRGRNSIKRGPFWMGRLGLFANIVTVAWTGFALVFYCFPTVMPATGGNMNYASAVLVAFFLYAIIYWVVRGRVTFQNRDTSLQVFAKNVKDDA